MRPDRAKTAPNMFLTQTPFFGETGFYKTDSGKKTAGHGGQHDRQRDAREQPEQEFWFRIQTLFSQTSMAAKDLEGSQKIFRCQKIFRDTPKIFSRCKDLF